MVADAGALIFDHLGIVTPDLDEGVKSLAAMVKPTGYSKRFDDPFHGVSVRFLRDRAGMTYELIAPLGSNSPIARTVATKKSVLNQVAYLTSSLEDCACSLRTGGSVALGSSAPGVAFGGALVQFFWQPLGFIIEVIELERSVHVFTSDLPD